MSNGIALSYRCQAINTNKQRCKRDAQFILNKKSLCPVHMRKEMEKRSAKK